MPESPALGWLGMGAGPSYSALCPLPCGAPGLPLPPPDPSHPHLPCTRHHSQRPLRSRPWNPPGRQQWKMAHPTMCWLCSGFAPQGPPPQSSPTGETPRACLRLHREATGAHQPRTDGDNSRPTEGLRVGRGAHPPPQPNLFPGTRGPVVSHSLLGAWSTCHGYAPSLCIQGWDSWETSRSSHLGRPCRHGDRVRISGPPQTVPSGSRRWSPNSSSRTVLLTVCKK